MTKESLVKRVNQEVEDDGDDFVVGTIAGLEVTNENKVRQINKRAYQQPKGDEVAMTTQTVEPTPMEIVSPESLEGTVMIKLRKQYKKLVDVILKTNDNVTVQEFDTHFQINAPQIRVSRQDGERALGRLNDGQWRILFMNREGELASFNDYEFVLGVIQTEVEETKETAQLNTRIDAKTKVEMDEIREMLGMTQSKFLEVAINEYTQRVRAEML